MFQGIQGWEDLLQPCPPATRMGTLGLPVWHCSHIVPRLAVWADTVFHQKAPSVFHGPAPGPKKSLFSLHWVTTANVCIVLPTFPEQSQAQLMSIASFMKLVLLSFPRHK